MAAEKDILYIKLEQNVEVQKQDITLADIARMECTDAKVLNRLKTVKFYQIHPDKRGKFRKAFSVLDVIHTVHEQFPGLEIQNLGECDFILTYMKNAGNHPIWDWAKTAAVGTIIFFGAAFSIMAFNNDISVTKLFAQIHEQITGEETDGYTVLEVSYSIGLSAGVLLFFNHFWGKKLTADPTPIEVEMKMYEKDINTALIDESSRGGKGKRGTKSSPDGSGGI